MGQVTVTVNGRSYVIGCDDGEEEHIRYLADYVDNRVQELVGSAGQVGEARLLLMAALTVADDLATAYDEIESVRTDLNKAQAAPAASPGRADQLEILARRLEDIAVRLEKS